MFISLFGLVLLRQVLLYMGVNMFYFCILAPSLLLVIEIFLKKPIYANFINRVDSFFLGFIPVQFLLFVSMKIETWLAGKNFLVSFIISYLLSFLFMYSFYGLVFLATSNPDPSMLQLLQVFLLVWLTFYFRLRMGYLNYYNLGIDTLSVNLDDILKLYKDKYNLSFKNYFHSKDPIILASLQYSSVKKLKDDIRLAYQTRGMFTAARTFVSGAAKAVADHPLAFATFAAGGMSAGAAVININANLNFEREKMQFEREKVQFERSNLDRFEKLERDKLAFREKQYELEAEKFKASQQTVSPSNNPPSEVSFNECDSSIVTLLNSSFTEALPEVFSI